MINMTQASATEKKGASDLLRFKIFGMPLPLYAFALITLLLSHFYNAIPTDLVGGFALMFVMGAIFGEIGKRLPIFNKYIGGAPVMIFLVAAYFVYAGIFTQKEIDAISNVMDKNNFLNLFIAVLITGAILSVNRKLLLKSLLGYIPTILAGIVGASLFGIVIGLCFGIPVDRIMMLYVLPIMGGGNGAGAVPLSEIYHSVTGRSREEYYSTAIAILTIANIFAIIFAALLDMIGKNTLGLAVKASWFVRLPSKPKMMKRPVRLPIVKRRLAWCYPPPASCWPMSLPKNSAKHRRRLYSLLRLDGPDCCCAERIRSLLTGD